MFFKQNGIEVLSHYVNPKYKNGYALLGIPDLKYSYIIECDDINIFTLNLRVIFTYEVNKEILTNTFLRQISEFDISTNKADDEFSLHLYLRAFFLEAKKTLSGEIPNEMIQPTEFLIYDDAIENLSSEVFAEIIKLNLYP